MTHYPRPAIVLCVALGMALGMIGWALLIHDSNGGAGASRQTPSAQQAPSR